MLREAFRWVRARPDRIDRALVAVLAVAAVMGMLGGTWDAAWHVTLRRESFWSPPHLLLYAGTALSLFVGVVALGSALLGRWLPEGASGGARRSIPRGFAVSALGSAVVLAAAPVDDFWHRTFGPDVDVWSFPHLVAIAGGALINLGALMVLGAEMRRVGGRPLGHRAAMLLFLTILVWLTMFSLNWYTLVLARWRDSFQYPMLAALVAPAALVIATRTFGAGGATLAALGYTAYTAAAHYALAGLGYALLPFPPVLLAAAVAVDLIAHGSRLPGWQRALLAGALFAPTFLVAEAASLAWYPHPFIVEPPPGALALGYYLAAAERPWEPVLLLRTLPAMACVSAASAVAGWWIGGVTRAAQTDPRPRAAPRAAVRQDRGGVTFPRLLR